MTCIVGIAQNGHVYLGGDSAGLSGWDLRTRKDEKVFRNGEFVMGFTTSFRMGQLLRYAFVPPDFTEGGDLYKYMVTDFVNALRQCFKDGGFAEKRSEQEQGGCFLVGVRGRLFEIDSDYQVGEHIEPYAAVGCGAGYALGSLHTSHMRWFAPERLKMALEAAETLSGGVRHPFNYVSTGD